jgi:UTP--glucose-1-phosphate uridylyltransferase
MSVSSSQPRHAVHAQALGEPLGPAVTKAVIPAAGLGTRFLPATKATPKEMLPVVDKPAIQYVVEEAVAAHLTDVLVITGRNKQSLEDHFDRVTELETALMAKGDDARLARVRKSNVLADMHYTRQGDPAGLGHAVLCGAAHVGDNPFAVLLGDDLIDERETLLADLVAVQRRTRASVIALMEVPPETIQLYGCAAVEPTGDPEVVRVTRLVEKPAPAEAPSNLAVIGRYVLHPRVFDVLRATPPGRGGEIQLTDALQTLAQLGDQPGGGVYGVIFRGRRYDTGDRLDYLKAGIRIASERSDLGPDLRAWLRSFVAGLPPERAADPLPAAAAADLLPAAPAADRLPAAPAAQAVAGLSEGAARA